MAHSSNGRMPIFRSATKGHHPHHVQFQQTLAIIDEKYEKHHYQQDAERKLTISVILIVLVMLVLLHYISTSKGQSTVDLDEPIHKHSRLPPLLRGEGGGSEGINDLSETSEHSEHDTAENRGKKNTSNDQPMRPYGHVSLEEMVPAERLDSIEEAGDTSKVEEKMAELIGEELAQHIEELEHYKADNVDLLEKEVQDEIKEQLAEEFANG